MWGRESLTANDNDVISVSLKNIRVTSSGRGRRAKRGGVGFLECGSTVTRGQPPPLRGTSFQRKEGEKRAVCIVIGIVAAKPPREPSTLSPEPNESKVKRGCEEMRIHFFTAPFLWGKIDFWGKGDGLFLLTVSMLRASSKDLRRLFPPLHTHLRRQRPCAGSGYRFLFRRIRRGDGSSHRHRRPWY